MLPLSIYCTFCFSKVGVPWGNLSSSPSHHSDMYVLFMNCGDLTSLFCLLQKQQSRAPKAFYTVGVTFAVNNVKTLCFTQLLLVKTIFILVYRLTVRVRLIPHTVFTFIILEKLRQHFGSAGSEYSA